MSLRVVIRFRLIEALWSEYWNLWRNPEERVASSFDLKEVLIGEFQASS